MVELSPALELLVAQIDARLGRLDTRLGVIVQLRYGLDRGVPRTLDEVGEHLGLTRERIRQILLTINPELQEMLDELSRERELTAKSQWRSQIREDVLAHPGTTPHEVVLRLGSSAPRGFRLDEATVRSAFSAAERQKYFVFPRSREIQWADDEILDSLRRAAALRSPLSHQGYDQLRTTGDLDGPSSALILQRFDSWRVACQRAGVQPGQQRRRNYVSNWTDEELLGWIVAGLQRGHRTGTVAGMERWLRKQPGAPSFATVRNRLGTWNQIKTDALRTIARRDVF
jgi:hypothetical protein